MKYKEDWPDNSQPEVNLFAVPAGATGEEAELRRGFFDRTGMYLLFSDTLTVREVTGMGVRKRYILKFIWSGKWFQPIKV